MKKSDMCSLITHLGKKSTLSLPYFSSLLSCFLLYTYTDTRMHTHTRVFFFFDIVFYNEPDLNDEFIHRYKQYEWKKICGPRKRNTI